MKTKSIFQWTILSCYTVKKLILVVCIVFVVDFLYLSSKTGHSAGDGFMTFILGYGQNYFYLIEFLFFLIINGIPLFFSALTLDEQSQKMSLHTMIRYQSRRRYFYFTQMAYGLFLPGYLLLHVFVISLHAVLFQLDWNFGEFTYSILNELAPGQIEAGKAVILSFLLRLLELFCVQGFIVFLQAVTNRVSTSFLIVLCGYFALWFVSLEIYPFGLSSFLRWISITSNPYLSFFLCVLLFLGILSLFYLYLLKIGIYRLLER